MRKTTLLSILILTSTFSLNVFGQEISNEDNNFVTGEIIAQYKYSNFLPGGTVNIGDYRLKIKDATEGGIVLLETDNTIEEVINKLKEDSNVITAEPNYIRKEGGFSSNGVQTNDFFGNEQWGLTYISRPEAYNKYKSYLEKGSNVVVGVVDDGVNYNHVDLKNSMWNPGTCKFNGSTIGCNHGYDFYYNSSTPLPVGDNHGTHIAGIIAAQINNGKGIIGVNPYAKIASLRVTDKYSSTINNFDDFSILKAIDFSIANGINIINASYGGTNYSETMKAKIREYGEHGGLFITTAMNNGYDMDTNGSTIYPCGYDLDNIICVTSIGRNGNKSDFANVGSKSVDIAAPGEGILSTINNKFDTYNYFEDFESCPSGRSRGSCGWDGTYQFSEGVNSPYYSIRGYGEHILNFSIGCYGGGNTINIRINGGEGTSYSINVYSNRLEEYKVLLPSNLSSFSFSLENEGGSSCRIDNVGVYEVKYYDNNSDAYDFWDGTSMATPYVAGLASLIRTLNPGLTPLQVKNLILNNGDDNASLRGVTVSGKTINVKKTLDAVTINQTRSSRSNNTNNNYSYSYENDVMNDFYSFIQNGTQSPSSYYTQEEIEAFNFARENGLISASSISDADMGGYLNRISMAKILSQFAINVMGLEPDSSKYTSFNDVSISTSAKYNDAPLLAYQLGIMGVNAKNFRPYDTVTRAEFASVLSRMVYGTRDGSNGNNYYEPHLNKLRNEGILTNTNPSRYEKRGLVLIMLMRTAQQNNF